MQPMNRRAQRRDSGPSRPEKLTETYRESDELQRAMRYSEIFSRSWRKRDRDVSTGYLQV